MYANSFFFLYFIFSSFLPNPLGLFILLLFLFSSFPFRRVKLWQEGGMFEGEGVLGGRGG